MLFSFGVVADPQYGDLPVGHDKNPNKLFWEVPAKLDAALTEFKSQEVPFIMQLGDIIEGNVTEEKTEEDFQLIYSKFEAYEADTKTRIYHVVGNHGLAFPRQVLLPRLHITPVKNQAAYYRVDNAAIVGWRFLVLDSMDIGWHGSSPDNEAEGRAWFAKHGPHRKDEDSKYPQAEKWNGGIGKEQQQWLLNQFTAASDANEKVILFPHIPIHPAAADARHVLWNSDEMIIFLRDAQRDLKVNIVAVIAGHMHVGGYAYADGIHHVTLHGMVEVPTNSNAFGIIEVHEKYLHLKGYGSLPSRILPVNPVELFHFPMSHCSRKIRLFLEEMNVGYRDRVINLATYQQFSSDYVKLNPQMVVPTLRVNGTDIICNSKKILLFLNEYTGYPLMPKEEEEEDNEVRTQILYWLNKQDTFPMRSLSFGRTMKHDVGDIQMESKFAVEKKGKFAAKLAKFDEAMNANKNDPAMLELYQAKRVIIAEQEFANETSLDEYNAAWKLCNDVLDEVEKKLEDGRQYIVGNRYTLGDVGLAAFLWRLHERQYGEQLWGVHNGNPLRPFVAQYFTRLSSRPGFQSAIKEWLPKQARWPFPRDETVNCCD